MQKGRSTILPKSVCIKFLEIFLRLKLCAYNICTDQQALSYLEITKKLTLRKRGNPVPQKPTLKYSGSSLNVSSDVEITFSQSADCRFNMLLNLVQSKTLCSQMCDNSLHRGIACSHCLPFSKYWMIFKYSSSFRCHSF